MPVQSSPSYAMIGLAFGLVILTLAIARYLLRSTSFSTALAFFLSISGVLCLGYVIVLYFMVGHFRYNVAEPELVEPLTVPNETKLIELTPPEKDAAKPTWINAEPRLVGDRYEISVASDPKLTASEAQADLLAKNQFATRKYIDDLLNEAADQVQLNSDFIAKRIQRETYLEPVKLTVGDMIIAHSLLVFDNGVRDEFRQQAKALEVGNSMAQAGVIAGAVLFVVGVVFGYLKLDTLTRGYYTVRLQLAAAALILGVLLLVGMA
jgi:hypothetical protein